MVRDLYRLIPELEYFGSFFSSASESNVLTCFFIIFKLRQDNTISQKIIRPTFHVGISVRATVTIMFRDSVSMTVKVIYGVMGRFRACVRSNIVKLKKTITSNTSCRLTHFFFLYCHDINIRIGESYLLLDY